MPEGIVIIDWDEFEGGVVSFKYPDIEVPSNLVQLLQISHSFNPGLITIQETDFHALSIGNEDLQKVIVLILNKFEDASDFTEIIYTINKSVSDHSESQKLENELTRIFGLSQSVFKAREAVLTKLANEVTELKNREIDLKLSLEWLLLNETSPENQIILVLLRYGSMQCSNLTKYIELPETEIQSLLNEMETKKILENRDGFYFLLIHYQIS
ncbi:hypothetical protein NEF87_005022 [Candidatus Lokiarchaeum ossiferum]|uniref:Uncharacterized protein n=1 Tax=Candidatus Lokiarchaeum ossiferum TaxID=2951803 RepID=A0ABY6HYZ8_9ARCH|nr:hypothetical protein NEF87_005022 [Candidatus Lokiarchaeum sp. B-35]